MANLHSFLLFAVLLISGVLVPRKDLLAAADCRSDIGDLVSNCEQYVQKLGPKIPPSSACCDIVRQVNIPCVCNLVTQRIESIISMEKVVYVARTCGKDVPSGTHCGSYTVPKA